MSQEITMPKLGLTMTSGKITKWLKKEGEPVKAGEPIVEIETDKINTEVESPADGILIKILAGEGEDREITTPIAIIGDEDEAETVQNRAGSVENGPDSVSRVLITPAAKKLAMEKGLDYHEIKGTGPGGRIQREDIVKAAEQKNAALQQSRQGTGIRITPLARKMAEENGIDYLKLKGTGPEGRIVKSDILSAIAPAAAVDIINSAAETAEERKAPLEGIRKIIAEKLSRSKHDIPHVYFKVKVDAGNMIELKERLSDSVKGITGRKLSINEIVLKAAAIILGKFPDINVSLIDNEIVYHRDINIGMAVSLEEGLIVPVIKNAGHKSLAELNLLAGELAEKARSGKLKPDEIAGGTFTVTNLGSFGIDEFSAIINPPESAILAVGRAADTPVAVNGQVVLKPVMVLTLSVDHRVIDGVLAAQFMKKLKEILENPYLLLL